MISGGDRDNYLGSPPGKGAALRILPQTGGGAAASCPDPEHQAVVRDIDSAGKPDAGLRLLSYRDMRLR
jgi:hypothetical protein